MSLERDIKDVSCLFSLVAGTDFGEDALNNVNKSFKEIDDFVTTDNIIELSKNINFPDLEQYAKMYIKLHFCLMVAEKFHLLKDITTFHKDYINLMKYVNDICYSDIDSITFKTKDGKTLKLTSENITSNIFGLTKEHFSTPEFAEISEQLDKYGMEITPKLGRYNKEFIAGLFPLFKHLKTHNPELTNNDLYNYLREFIIELGFDFNNRYPNSVGDDEPFKSYFSGLK